VRRYLAALVALSVCSLQAQALAFHVHRGADHDADDRHTHGPAIHHHSQHHSEAHYAVSAAEEEESTGGVVTLTVPAAVHLDAVPVCGPVEVASFEPTLELVQRMVAHDVRSHGPPSLLRPSYRGPPASLPS
jgi:hypothetical protein